MNEYTPFLPKIEIGKWVENFVYWLLDNFREFFDGIAGIIHDFVNGMVDIFHLVHPFIFILIIAAIAFWRSGIGVALFSLIGLWLIFNMGFWFETLQTIALVFTSVIISVLVGVPFGILVGLNDTAKRIITPILDFMQTMPAFVYLIPMIFFFGIGMAPGVVATVIFSMPPTIRLTGLGIRQVPEDLIEASNAFGSTTMQKLFKVQLPLSLSTMMAGINQNIMLALSMVVIASLVGAPGLGEKVFLAVTQLEIDVGVESGLAIVIIAIALDRISQNIGKKKD